MELRESGVPLAPVASVRFRADDRAVLTVSETLEVTPMGDDLVEGARSAAPLGECEERFRRSSAEHGCEGCFSLRVRRCRSRSQLQRPNRQRTDGTEYPNMAGNRIHGVGILPRQWRLRSS